MIASTIALLMVVPGSAADPLGQVTEYSVGLTAGSDPRGVAAGPDGNMWFTESSVTGSGRSPPAGSHGIRSRHHCWRNEAIAAGPDGNMWFTEAGGNRIGKITPKGKVTEYRAGISSEPALRHHGGARRQHVVHRVAGNRIGKITPSGTITEYTAVSAPGALRRHRRRPRWESLVFRAGRQSDRADHSGRRSDRVLGWDQSKQHPRLHRPRGRRQHVVHRVSRKPDRKDHSIRSCYRVLRRIPAGSYLVDIAAGPDGNLWFTRGANAPWIGRITPTGTVTQFSAGISAGSDLFGIAAGPDGNMWFAESTGNRIGKIGVGPVVDDLQIQTVSEIADPVARYARFEASIELNEGFANPFDPDEIAVDVTFTSPTGHVQQVPAFWYEPFTITGTPSSEQYASAGAPGWRIRFAADEAGTYSYSVSAVAGARTATPVSGSFQAAPAAPRGFVRVDDRNARYLRYDDGSPYVPVGHNLAFEDSNPPLGGVGYWTSLFGSLDTAGENWSRIWMTDFNRSALEWGPGHYSGFYDGVGKYSLPSAWRMDRILELAEQHGIELQLVLNDHGQFSTWVNARWAPRCSANDTPPCEPGDEGYDPGNAYSSANGGPVDIAAPQDFFSNADARRLFKQRLRYLVARYGAYTSLLAWELFNEVQFIGTNSVNAYGDAGVRADVAAWHTEMGGYLHSIDPYEHLVTTSSWDPFSTNDLWPLPGIDVVQIHTYSSPSTNRTVEIRDLVANLKSTLAKPVIVGELGLGSGDPEAGFNPTTFGGTAANREHLVQGTHMHNAAWAAALSESGAAYWWWGNYIAADASNNRVAPAFPLNERIFPPLLAYLQGEDWAPLGLDTAQMSVVGTVTAVGVQQPDQGLPLGARHAERVRHRGASGRPRLPDDHGCERGRLGDGRRHLQRPRLLHVGSRRRRPRRSRPWRPAAPSPSRSRSFTRDLALKVDFFAPPDPAGRSRVDQPDDRTGKQIHLVYAIPSDGIDRELDVNGTIAGSVASIQTWLAEPDRRPHVAAGHHERRARHHVLRAVANGRGHRERGRVRARGDRIRAERGRLRRSGQDLRRPLRRHEHVVVRRGRLAAHNRRRGLRPLPPGSSGRPRPVQHEPLRGRERPAHVLGVLVDARDRPHARIRRALRAEPHACRSCLGADERPNVRRKPAVGPERCRPRRGQQRLLRPHERGLYRSRRQRVPRGPRRGHRPSRRNGDHRPRRRRPLAPRPGRGGGDDAERRHRLDRREPRFRCVAVRLHAPRTGGEHHGSRSERWLAAEACVQPDPSLLPAGETAQTVQVFRNGVQVGECPGSSTASPNPCVSARVELANGVARLTTLTGQASRWTVGVRGATLAVSCAAAPPTGAIVGTAGSNKITGTSAANVIFALGGDDTIDGGGGNDVICAGPGRTSSSEASGTTR